MWLSLCQSSVSSVLASSSDFPHSDNLQTITKNVQHSALSSLTFQTSFKPQLIPDIVITRNVYLRLKKDYEIRFIIDKNNPIENISPPFQWQLNLGLDLDFRKHSPQIALFTSLEFLKCNFTVATYTTNSLVTLRLRSQYSRNVFTVFQRWKNFLAFGSEILPQTNSAPLKRWRSKTIDISFFFYKLYFEEEHHIFLLCHFIVLLRSFSLTL